MQYDRAIKELFIQAGTNLLTRLGGAPPREWLDIELPQTRAPRADLVCWLMNDKLIHLEFQSYNEPDMAWRMLDYRALLEQAYRVEPAQFLLYIGEPPLRMPGGITGTDLVYRYGVLDIRDFDGDELLNSNQAGDVVLAFLCRGGEQRARAIIDRLKSHSPQARQRGLRLFLILSDLRPLTEPFYQEIESMSFLIDEETHPYLKRVLARGEVRGELRGERKIVHRMLESRFGPLPDWAEQRLEAADLPMIDRFADRILSADRLDQIFQ